MTPIHRLDVFVLATSCSAAAYRSELFSKTVTQPKCATPLYKILHLTGTVVTQSKVLVLMLVLLAVENGNICAGALGGIYALKYMPPGGAYNVYVWPTKRPLLLYIAQRQTITCAFQCAFRVTRKI